MITMAFNSTKLMLHKSLWGLGIWNNYPFKLIDKGNMSIFKKKLFKNRLVHLVWVFYISDCWSCDISVRLN